MGYPSEDEWVLGLGHVGAGVDSIGTWIEFGYNEGSNRGNSSYTC